MRIISTLLLPLLFAANTHAQAPTVKAVPANRVTYYGANLNVLVNPNKDSTTISFEYGLDTSYGSTATVTGKYTGTITLFKTLAINGLTPGKTYHYRAKAINDSGTTYGSDRIFITGSSFSKSTDGGHTICVNDVGIVYTFGDNSRGQLGDYTYTDRTTPIKVFKGAYSGITYLGDDTNNPIISVVTGGAHSLALAADGLVYSFGNNSQGQLGDSTTSYSTSPIKVLKGAYGGTTYLGDNPNNPIISVYAGHNRSIALAADGSVYAFGSNQYGQLGDSTLIEKHTPIQVKKGAYNGTAYLGDDANNPIISVAAGDGHNIALAADGSLYAFGMNAGGQLGGNSSSYEITPIQVLKGAYSGTTYLGDNANNPIISVAAGHGHSITIAADGSVYAFGDNSSGELGDSSFSTRKTPVKVCKGAYSGTRYLGDNISNPIISAAAGFHHSIILAADGSVYAIGYNSYGQLGDNTYDDSWTPVKVLKGAYSGNTYLGKNSNNPIISVANGYYHSIALAADGTVYTFGENSQGQLGNNSTANRNTPIQVIGVGARWTLDLIDGCENVLDTLNIITCNSYSFKGKTRTVSGIYYDSLINARGCDSVVILMLTINSTPIDLKIITCDSYIFHGDTLTSSGIYYDTLTNIKGCDSVIKLNLTIKNSTRSSISPTVCDFYWFYGYFYTASGVYVATIFNSVTCDSVVTLNLTINKSVHDSVSITACNSYFFNGQTLTKAGVYYDTLATVFGCDSFVKLNLSFNSAITNNLNITACNSYTFKGNNITTSGIYYDSLTSAKGCDSIITLTLTINTVNNAVTQSNTVLTATQTGATYQWLDCKTGYSAINGATSQSYTATANGDYAVAVTLNGCSDTSACVTVSSIGLTPGPSPKERGELVIYPNPNNGEFTIQSGSKGIFTIINELGQSIQTIQLSDAYNHTVNIGNLSAGVYFIVGYNNNELTRQKVVVVR